MCWVEFCWEASGGWLCERKRKRLRDVNCCQRKRKTDRDCPKIAFFLFPNGRYQSCKRKQADTSTQAGPYHRLGKPPARSTRVSSESRNSLPRHNRTTQGKKNPSFLGSDTVFFSLFPYGDALSARPLESPSLLPATVLNSSLSCRHCCNYLITLYLAVTTRLYLLSLLCWNCAAGY